MDLFGDIPHSSTAPKVITPTRSLAQPFQKKNTGFDLFGDLPEEEEETRKGTEARGEKRKDEGEPGTPEKRRNTGGLFEVTSFFAARQGEREEMQDAHVTMDSFTQKVPNLHNEVNRLAFYAVYDGHGGERAAKFAEKNLHDYLAQRLPKGGDLSKLECEMKKVLVDTYKKTDEDFLKRAAKQKPSWKDGTTATTVLLLNNTLYIANVGDSKAVLCRKHQPKETQKTDGETEKIDGGKDKTDGGKDTKEKEKSGPESKKKEADSYVALNLIKEHSPTLYEERMRIQKAGGTVREGRVMGILEVSRSLGDGPYKRHGVSCIPDVKRCQLSANDRFLIIACDGLWKTFTNDAAIQLVNKILQDESIKGTEQKSSEEARWETACNTLANEAVRRLSADNVTVILVRIRASPVAAAAATHSSSSKDIP